MRDVEKIMRAQPLDFVQVSYNVLDREVENRILPLARERGIAVIVNRPFREGDLVRTIMRKPLPPFARSRRDKLGAAHPEVHHLASGGDLRHPGDHARRSCAGECGRGARSAARCGMAREARRACR